MLSAVKAPIAGARSADGRSFARSAASLLDGVRPSRWMAELAGSATTIGVVATDALLTKTQANQLAALAHHGLPRAIDPLTLNDGDTLFALATGAAGRAAALPAWPPLPAAR